MAEIVLDVDIDAPAERVWAALVAWDTQGEWMLLTRVRGTTQDGIGVGGGIEGFTGIGPVGVLDTMRITRWDPPRQVRCCTPAGSSKAPAASRWSTWGPDAPGSSGRRSSTCRWVRSGRLGFPLVRPLFAWGVQRSLRRFARYVERGGGVATEAEPQDPRPDLVVGEDGLAAARGVRARTTAPTTTRNGAGRCTATSPCSNG